MPSRYGNAMTSIAVRPVLTKADRKAFVDLDRKRVR
jgi:hypothetical protein